MLIAKIDLSEQAKDLTVPSNCKGFGRVRHFKRLIDVDWPLDPLPIDPACKALNLSTTDMIKAQVFQVAGCDWRCWYCFVPLELVSANTGYAKWLTPGQLMEFYLNEENPPPVIDLSGGSPSLTPEWVPWMIEELIKRNLNNVYLWSDDNLSNDYLWRFLSEKELELISTFKNYGRVCCFKGFSPESFTFNTGAEAECYERQFAIMKRLVALGLDLYGYTTFTTPSSDGIKDAMCRFIDKLQQIDENLPLRTVPLKIQVFTPVQQRMNKIREEAIKNQWVAVELWKYEIEKRFSAEERLKNITDMKLKIK